MFKYILLNIFFICSQLAFASDSGSSFPRPGNLTQEMFQEHSLNSIQINTNAQNTNTIHIEENSHEDPVIIVSSQGTEFVVSMNEMLEIISIVPSELRNQHDQRKLALKNSTIRYLLKKLRQGTPSGNTINVVAPFCIYQLTLSQTLLLLEMAPLEIITFIQNDNSLRVNLSDLAVYVLVRIAMGELEIIETKFINAPNDILDELAEEAKTKGISAITKVIRKYAPYLQKSSTGEHDKVVVKKQKKNDGEAKSTEFVNCADFGITSRTIRMGTSPIKGCIAFKAKNKDGKEIRILTSDDYEFSSGFFINFCPICPYASIALNANLEEWNDLVDDFVDLWFKAYKNNSPFTTEERMMLLFSLFLHKEDIRSRIHRIAIQRTTIFGDECRHYSFYGAVLFSKVLGRLNLSKKMRIQVIESRTFNTKDLSRVSKSAHQWNLVSVFDEGKDTQYYFLDITNFVMVHLDLNIIRDLVKAGDDIEGLRVIFFPNKVLLTKLKKTNDFYEYVLSTIEIKFADAVGVNSIYSETKAELLALLGRFFASKYCIHPQEEFEIITYRENAEKK